MSGGKMPRTTRLFEVAERKGITQRELAKLTGIPESTLSRVRRGERGVTVDFMDQVNAKLPGWVVEEGDLFPQEPVEAAS
jgi:transcriptional regulator with XRE-family HTH domain